MNLAALIVNLLNDPGHNFSIGFTAERRVVPYEKPDDLKLVKVSVFSGTRAADERTRDGFLRKYKPVIAIQKKLQSTTEVGRVDEADNLDTLVREIEDVLAGNDLDGYTLQEFDGEQDRDTYGIEAMRSHGVFAVALTLTYGESS